MILLLAFAALAGTDAGTAAPALAGVPPRTGVKPPLLRLFWEASDVVVAGTGRPAEVIGADLSRGSGPLASCAVHVVEPGAIAVVFIVRADGSAVLRAPSEPPGLSDCLRAAIASVRFSASARSDDLDQTVTLTLRARDPVAAMGRIAKDEVLAVIKKHSAPVEACYARELPRIRGVAGSVAVAFVIAADGSVSEAAAKDPPPGLVAVGKCVARAVGRWRFPKPTGGVVVVTTAFAFPPSP